MPIPGVGHRPRPRPQLPRPRIPAGWRPRLGAGPGGGGGGLGAPEADPYDYSADPLLQRMRAFGAQRLAEAQAAAIRARQVAESDYGNVQARLGRERVERPKALTESLNKGNLFYSSEFGKQQTDLSRVLAESAAEEQRRHQERLTGIEQGVLDVGREVEGENMSAEEAAAARLQERLGDQQFQQPQPRPVAGPVARALRGRTQGFRPGRPAPRPRPRPRPRRPGGGYGGPAY